MSRSPCPWIEDGDAVWDTRCGHSFVLIAGTPHDNQMRFCPYCGRPLVLGLAGAARPHPTRGFASLTPEQRTQVARQGAAAAAARGTAHRWTHDTAQQAGRKGVIARHQKRDKVQ